MLIYSILVYPFSPLNTTIKYHVHIQYIYSMYSRYHIFVHIPLWSYRIPCPLPCPITIWSYYIYRLYSNNKWVVYEDNMPYLLYATCMYQVLIQCLNTIFKYHILVQYFSSIPWVQHRGWISSINTIFEYHIDVPLLPCWNTIRNTMVPSHIGKTKKRYGNHISLLLCRHAYFLLVVFELVRQEKPTWHAMPYWSFPTLWPPSRTPAPLQPTILL